MDGSAEGPGVTVTHDGLVTREKLLISTTLSVCPCQCQHISTTSHSLSQFISYYFLSSPLQHSAETLLAINHLLINESQIQSPV